MASLSYDSSDDDEDDIYCNAAARLKDLKNQRKNNPQPLPRQKQPRIIPVLKEPGAEEIKIDDNTSFNNSTCPENQSPNDDDLETLSDSEDSCIEDRRNEPIILNDPITIPDSPINILDSPIPEGIDADNKSIEELDDSINDFPIVDVHVKWKSNKIECLHLNKNEPLRKIFQHFAHQENIPVNRVFFYKRDIPITTSDTPSSLKLSIIDVLEGGTLNSGTSKIQSSEGDEETDKNLCKIKAQISSKKSFTFRLGKNDIFRKLKCYCSGELGVSIDKIKLYFDGEHISDSDTPDSLDLDDEACIDIKIVE